MCAANEVLSLPVHPFLSDHEVDLVIDAVNRAEARRG
jgi:dTDP-4-amino-4,6-dideoxygalactose transaminase